MEILSLLKHAGERVELVERPQKYIYFCQPITIYNQGISWSKNKQVFRQRVLFVQCIFLTSLTMNFCDFRQNINNVYLTNKLELFFLTLSPFDFVCQQ